MGGLGRILLEEDLVGMEVGVFGEAIESVFEGGLEVITPFLQRQHDAHEDFAGSCAGIGLRAEARFAGDDQRAQGPFGEVVVPRDVGIVGLMIHPVGLSAKDVLNPLDAGMTGGTVDGIYDGLLGRFGAFVEFPVADG